MPLFRPTSRFVPGAFRTAPLLLLLSTASGAHAEEIPGPRAAATALQTAFTECDPAPIRPFLSRRLKTYLALGVPGSESGYYGADQAMLMLRRLFARRTTLRFALAEPPDRPGQAPVVLSARWTFKVDGSDRGEAQLAFTLGSESGGWRIREIRAQK
jgi:hypothetical protein